MPYRSFTVRLLVSCACFLGIVSASHAHKEPGTLKPEVYLPRHLKLEIGGFLGPSYVIELKDHTLTYQEYAPGRQLKTEQTIAPTEKQWQQFWEAMETVQVWKWEGNYLNPSAHDGTQWNLTIEHGDKKISTSGSNSYPRDDSVKHTSNDPVPSKIFGQYLTAVEALLGGKQFR